MGNEVNMRCAIITFTYGDNYGQRLQNLAMQEMLKDYFDEVFTIKQIPPKKSLKEKIKCLLNLYKKQLKKRHNSFQIFDKENILYYSIPISKESADFFPEEKFDFFVVGSDQVWSPFSPDVNSTMFLTFVTPNKRIAISPSLACDNIPTEQKDKYFKYLNGIKNISTREEQGSEIVANIIGRDVPTLLDPTLVHKQKFWDNYIKETNFKIPQKYCFCYCLGSNEENSKIKELCDLFDLQVINMMTDKKYYSLGPGEFLYLIKNAELVITDSYHGTIFSYIFKVPFINFKRKGTSIDMNSRFNTLYKKMGIKPRYLYQIKEEEIFKIDFDLIDKNIENEKKQVFKFIENIVLNSDKKEGKIG